MDTIASPNIKHPLNLANFDVILVLRSTALQEVLRAGDVPIAHSFPWQWRDFIKQPLRAIVTAVSDHGLEVASHQNSYSHCPSTQSWKSASNFADNAALPEPITETGRTHNFKWPKALNVASSESDTSMHSAAFDLAMVSSMVSK